MKHLRRLDASPGDTVQLDPDRTEINAELVVIRDSRGSADRRRAKQLRVALTKLPRYIVLGPGTPGHIRLTDGRINFEMLEFLLMRAQPTMKRTQTHKEPELRPAADLAAERTERKKESDAANCRAGRQQAVFAIEEAHKKNSNSCVCRELPPAVLKELRDAGYTVSTTPATGPGEENQNNISWP